MIEYEDHTPITFRKFTKKFFNGKEWEEKIFYETRKDISQASTWLEEKYGRGSYCQSWWATHSAVCMSEKVYTHYALCV